LEKAGVDHALHDYEVDEAVGEGYGEAVAAAIGADETQVFKTLMVVVDGEHVVAIIPVTERLSMKKLAAAAGRRRAEMAATSDAERLTGYVSGGISPLGQRRRHRTFLDENGNPATTDLRQCRQARPPGRTSGGGAAGDDRRSPGRSHLGAGDYPSRRKVFRLDSRGCEGEF
jgi:Cys-tRNA(Pro) deacylase